MKQTTVLKALNSMDEKSVNEFLNDDLRNFGEIIEAVCEEVEVKYIEFMYELIQKCKAIEAEEKSKVPGNLVKSLASDDNVKFIKRDELILTDEQSRLFHETFKNLPSPLQSIFNLPKLDYTNLVQRKN